MNDHYYSSKPTAASRPVQFVVELRGMTFRFQSDAGVFSKHGIDFGSRLLIEQMDIPKGAHVLDVGCGYGPIGLVAARLSQNGIVTMVDVNERALSLARSNAERNGITNVRILASDALEAVLAEKFDRIVTNPPIRAGKEVVHRIFAQACDCLNPGGQLWVVIQKKQGAPSAFAKLQELFGEENVEQVAMEKGYRIYRAAKT